MHSLRIWSGKSTPTNLLLLGFLVGIGGAVGATIFHKLVYFSTLIFYGQDGSSDFLSLVADLPTWQRLLIPTLGGLLVGITYKFAKVSEAEGEGVPEVTEALAHKRGIIRPIVAPVKIITAAVTLGSGGSAGREGPVIQIGSAIGSSIAQFFKQAPKERSLLLAAGAAAGIGGTFGAPMAGVLFTVEILKHRPRPLRLFVLIIAAFVGAIFTRVLTGHPGLRFTPTYELEFNWILIFGVVATSIIAAVAAWLFEKFLQLGRFSFRWLPTPHLLKPAIGGLGVGVIGLFLPHIHEPAAYPFMVDILQVSTLSIGFLLILLFVKMIATSLTLGSGGSGGIFAPLLFMGVIIGSVIGSGLALLSIGNTSAVATLAIVGMATMFAAAAHAPLTAAFITYELTGRFILLPILIAGCLVATSLAKRLQKQSVYEHGLED